MQHVDLTHGNMIANEMKVDLDGSGALMLDGVRGHVGGANTVTEHNRSRRRWSMKLVEELANPTSLGNGISHSTALSLSARTRDCVFLI
jgi:hypothetical protein